MTACAALWAVGCEGVPTLTFETDASTDARSLTDTIGDETKDSTWTGASDSAPVAVACTTNQPVGVLCLCNETIACRGDCTPPACAACINKCKANEICCGKMNSPNPPCKSPPMSCP